VRRAALILFALSPLFGGEYAVLQNGFRIRADRHESAGETTRLITPQGAMELSTANIAKFEEEDYVPPPPKPAEPAAAPATTPDAPKPAVLDPKELLRAAAIKHGLKPEFVLSVAAAESALNQKAVSPKGAIGLMQLMPGTAADLGVDPKDAAQNADAGTRYLKELLVKYQNRPDFVRLALAAYNAGPGAVDKYRSIPPYRETMAYVERIVRRYMSQLK
jgi:soluble lytic murein transglycosylase-like protein